MKPARPLLLAVALLTAACSNPTDVCYVPDTYEGRRGLSARTTSVGTRFYEVSSTDELVSLVERLHLHVCGSYFDAGAPGVEPDAGPNIVAKLIDALNAEPDAGVVDAGVHQTPWR